MKSGHIREEPLFQIIKLREIFTILVYLTSAKILYVTKEPMFVLPKILGHCSWENHLQTYRSGEI
jgi:hypothetical protein